MSSRTKNSRLKGAFDLLLLFGQGIGAFSGKKKDALRSFVIPVALFPVTLFLCRFYPPKGMETGFSTGAIVGTVAAQWILSFVFSLALVTVLARSLGKLDKVWLFWEANNWTALAMFLVAFPFSAAAVFQWVAREQMDRVFVIMQVYGFIVVACIAYRAFKINWQLAGLVAVVTLFANEMAWEILFRALGIPDPW